MKDLLSGVFVGLICLMSIPLEFFLIKLFGLLNMDAVSNVFTSIYFTGFVMFMAGYKVSR